MRYIVYIDRLFLLQLVQSCVLLLLTRAFLRSTVTLKRIVFASAAGTLLFCVIFLLPGISRNIKVLLFALCSLATLWLAFRIRTLQVFCRAVILYHAAAFLLAGALYALLHAAGRRPAMTTMQASLCAVGVGTAALYILRWEKKSAQAVIVTAILEDGDVKITLEALIDSGNSLYDPISQRPVCVVEKAALEGKIPLKAHVHRVDDIYTAIRIAKEFGLSMTLDHCSEGHLIAEDLAKEGFPAIVGPDLSSRSKIEVQNMAFKTAGVLHEAGVLVAITTDHPVSLIQSLPICAGLAVKSGLPLEEGLRAITCNPARICRVFDRVGSLEPGKDADIAIFTGNPMETFTRTMCTIINGKIVYRDTGF